MALTKFCECFDLKIGFLIYGVILMMLRISSFGVILTLGMSIHSIASILLSVTMTSWNIGSTVILYLALKGVQENKSFLLLPNLAILPIEICGTVIFGITTAAVLESGLVCLYLLVVFIYIYHFLCLYGLYIKMKSVEDGKVVTTASAPIMAV